MKTGKLLRLVVTVGIALCMTVASLPALAADPPADDDTKQGIKISSQNKVKGQNTLKKSPGNKSKLQKNVGNKGKLRTDDAPVGDPDHGSRITGSGK